MYLIACTEIARLPNSLLFLPARICCVDKIKLISAQQNNSMQKPNSSVALGYNWDGVANDAKAINAGSPIKIRTLEAPTSCLK